MSGRTLNTTEHCGLHRRAESARSWPGAAAGCRAAVRGERQAAEYMTPRNAGWITRPAQKASVVGTRAAGGSGSAGCRAERGGGLWARLRAAG